MVHAKEERVNASCTEGRRKGKKQAKKKINIEPKKI